MGHISELLWYYPKARPHKSAERALLVVPRPVGIEGWAFAAGATKFSLSLSVQLKPAKTHLFSLAFNCHSDVLNFLQTYQWHSGINIVWQKYHNNVLIIMCAAIKNTFFLFLVFVCLTKTVKMNQWWNQFPALFMVTKLWSVSSSQEKSLWCFPASLYLQPARRLNTGLPTREQPTRPEHAATSQEVEWKPHHKRMVSVTTTEKRKKNMPSQPHSRCVWDELWGVHPEIRLGCLMSGCEDNEVFKSGLCTKVPHNFHLFILSLGLMLTFT